MPSGQIFTVGEDSFQVEVADDRRRGRAAEGDKFNPDVDKSVVESDYSDQDEDDQAQYSQRDIIVADNGSAVRNERVKKDFLLGCYVPKSLEDDLEYQEVVARRLEAVK